MKKPTRPRGTRPEEPVGWLGIRGTDSEEDIQQCCDELCRLAKGGDYWAAETLWQLARCAVGALETANLDAPEMFRGLAANQMAWPALIGRHRDIYRLGQKIIDAIGLGSNSPLSQTGKTWTLETPEAAVAFRLFRAIQSVRSDMRNSKRLPPLSRSNYRTLWKVTEPLFIQICGEDFENHKAFARYWKGDTDRETIPGNPSQKRPVANARALIRRDIKRNIKQAFRSISAKPSPV